MRTRHLFLRNAPVIWTIFIGGFSGAFFGTLWAQQPLPPPRYFPLETGMRWTYSNDRFGGVQERSVVREAEDGFVIFDRGFTEITLEDQGDSIAILFPDDREPRTYYEFSTDSWIHHDTDLCNDQRKVEVVSRSETVETPAGAFGGCLQIVYQQGNCSDAGLYAEWFAPEVGLVMWQESNIAGTVTWRLEEFLTVMPHKPFRRADVNGDDVVDISDAIGLLTHLFLEGSTVTCDKSADVNDDAQVDISDPIRVLSHKFLGATAPPPPYLVCGQDPSPDGLTCDDYSSCEED